MESPTLRVLLSAYVAQGTLRAEKMYQRSAMDGRASEFTIGDTCWTRPPRSGNTVRATHASERHPDERSGLPCGDQGHPTVTSNATPRDMASRIAAHAVADGVSYQGMLQSCLLEFAQLITETRTRIAADTDTDLLTDTERDDLCNAVSEALPSDEWRQRLERIRDADHLETSIRADAAFLVGLEVGRRARSDDAT